jgi:hypothetical protein
MGAVVSMPNQRCCICGLPADVVWISGDGNVYHNESQSCRDALLAQREQIKQAWEAVKPHVSVVGWSATKRMDDVLAP